MRLGLILMPLLTGAVVLAGSLASCDQPIENRTTHDDPARQARTVELTLEVNTPSGLKTGSQPVSLRPRVTRGLGERQGPHVEYEVRGRAVRVPIGDGRDAYLMLDKLTWYDPDSSGGVIAPKDLPTVGLWNGRVMSVPPQSGFDDESLRFRARWNRSEGVPLSGKANPIDSSRYLAVRNPDGRVYRMGLDRSKYVREDDL